MSAFETVPGQPAHGDTARPGSPHRGLVVIVAALVVTALVVVSTGASATVAGTPNDRWTGVSLESADRPGFATASVVKLLIALDVLRARDWQPPDPGTASAVTRVLRDSDDRAAAHLWAERGGPDVVTRMVAELNLTGTVAPSEPREWELTRTTGADVVAVYRFVLDRLPEPSRELVLSALREAPRIALDGVDQYFGIPDALPRLPHAIKQGWMVAGGELVLNTTGHVGAHDRFVVVLLTHQPGSTSRPEGGPPSPRGSRHCSPPSPRRDRRTDPLRRRSRCPRTRRRRSRRPARARRHRTRWPSAGESRSTRC
ncbi:hypothetical protein [Pseudonocardia sp. NPDC049635]|uniref:hypothetical protein n=1 Tax=Pseudonocardia sp. NPDC049635 TaxID=3155506 RepID=UPI003409180A